MSARERLEAQAFVLRHLNFGESDLIVTLFSLEYGKIKGLAKGARRSRKRFSNSLDLFSQSKILFSRKDQGGLALIEDSLVINHHGEIRNLLENTLLASYMVELVDLFTVENKASRSIYHVLASFLDALDRGLPGRRLIHFFELEILRAAGYEPVLDRCLRCGKPTHPGQNYHFSPREGGICCGGCLGAAPSFIPLSLGTIKSLLYGKNRPPEDLKRLAISEQAVREARLVLSRMIEYTLGRPVRSFQVLCDVEKWGEAARIES